MEWSEEEIKRAIAARRIRAITLDTSAFDRNGNRFEHGLLARLNQFNLTDVMFVLSDVVAGEVSRHVAQEAAEAKSKVVSALKEVGKSWQATATKREDALAILFGDESSEDLAQRRFETFTNATAAGIVHSAPRVNIDRMLTDYFSSNPPFGKTAAKKNEFPDAIALQALENWAVEQDTILLAVSQDADWRKFAKASERLVVIEDLALALSYFHQNADVACARLASRLASGDLDLDDALQSAVDVAVERFIFLPEISSSYHFDADVDEVIVTSVRLDETAYLSGPFRVVDKPSETQLVVEAEVEAELEVSADFSFSVTDSIDKDQVPVGDAHARTTIQRTFKVLLTFEGDLSSDAELTESEVWSKGGDVYIRVDFGELGPDWRSDPDDKVG